MALILRPSSGPAEIRGSKSFPHRSKSPIQWQSRPRVRCVRSETPPPAWSRSPTYGAQPRSHAAQELQCMDPNSLASGSPQRDSPEASDDEDEDEEDPEHPTS